MSEAALSAPRANGAFEGAVLIGPLVAIVALAVTLFAPQVMNDGDSWWHLAAGNWIIDHRAVPHTDIFSHSRLGAPWQPHEWLSEVAMALAYRAAGWSGLLILFALAAGSAMALMASRVSRSLSGSLLLSVLVLAFACLTPTLLLRPHVLTLPVIVAWTVEFLAARDERRAPRWWFAGLMVLWANLHGSYVFGLALAAPFALEALLDARTFDERRKVVVSWGAFGLLSLAATAVTPHGVQGLMFPFQLMSMTALAGIGEWKSADFTTLGPFEIAILATLYVAFRHPVKIPLVRLCLLLILLHMAFKHGRHLTVLAAVAPMVLAAPLAAALGRPATPRVPKGVLAGAVALAVALCGLRLALPVTPKDSDVNPITALAKVPSDIRSRPVLNEYGFGGYLIFHGVPTYVDGRTDMYGDAFMRRYLRMARGDLALLRETLAESDIGWTLLPPSHPLTPLMDREPGWRRLHADDHAVVHVRAP